MHSKAKASDRQFATVPCPRLTTGPPQIMATLRGEASCYVEPIVYQGLTRGPHSQWANYAHQNKSSGMVSLLCYTWELWWAFVIKQSLNINVCAFLFRAAVTDYRRTLEMQQSLGKITRSFWIEQFLPHKQCLVRPWAASPVLVLPQWKYFYR